MAFSGHQFKFQFAQRFTHWIQKFYIAAVDGDVEEFMIKFTCILQLLKKNAGSEHYKRMSEHQLKEHVMNVSDNPLLNEFR